MPLRLNRLDSTHPDLADDGTRLRRRLDELRRIHGPRLQRLWQYYRNPISARTRVEASDAAEQMARPYRQAQEWGLPSRITGVGAVLGSGRKEVVVENDIAWRIDSMIDFLFGQDIVISASVEETTRREQIDTVLRAVFARNGGLAFLQKMALLGAVYGYVDVLVKYQPISTTPQTPANPGVGDSDDIDVREGDDAASSAATAVDAEQIAQAIRFEIVEPSRALPFSSNLDPALIEAFAQTYDRPRSVPRAPGSAQREAARQRGTAWVDAVKNFLTRAPSADALRPDFDRDGEPVRVLELITPTRWQRYEDEQLVDEGENSLGRVPIVHVQNAAVPFEYAGKSDVEPLLPLQDELNTRLSDRAYRITMQSFKMYLGRGIDDFNDTPVGPGRMFTTENENASIVEFGGDANCPSEQAHVDEIREALDKTSGVSPIAAGAIKGRIGRLSSAAALRVTLLALLGRTERKRTTYGPAIVQLCELALAWLDRAGLFRTTPAERRVEIYSPNPIPANEQEQIDKAKAKKDLGIDSEQVARELGY